jgi:acetyl-CoA carboxylase carboxyl transferase subunit alpha
MSVPNRGQDLEKLISELEEQISSLKTPEAKERALAEGIDLDAELVRLEKALLEGMKEYYGSLSPWGKTQMARHKDRPYTLDYIRLIFDEFFELSGDRVGKNDEAVVGGLARLNGESVVVIGQQKGRDLKERQRRNFGSARAEGFRKALRLAKFAEKFNRPLISFVDTPAAAADLQSEERGISEAIARNLRDLSVLETPIVVAIIGEGGSGGALGMAVGDRVLMLEHSVYSVIPPEGCAAILWRDRDRADEAAQALNLTAQGAKSLGIIDEILPEPLGGAHRDPLATANSLKRSLLKHLGALGKLCPQDLVAARLDKIRKLGAWSEK